MILTGKAKEQFEKWLLNYKVGEIETERENIGLLIHDLNQNLQNSIIIDWLDSEGIFITVSRHGFTMVKEHHRDTVRNIGTRQETIKLAIKHANDFYNAG